MKTQPTPETSCADRDFPRPQGGEVAEEVRSLATPVAGAFPSPITATELRCSKRGFDTGVVCSEGSLGIIERALEVAGYHLLWVTHGCASARAKLARGACELLVVELHNDEASFFLAQTLSAADAPLAIAIGDANPRSAFTLAAMGVLAYFEGVGPTMFNELAARSPGWATAPALLGEVARRNTGHLGVKEAQRAVRLEMFREALVRARGNRHAAARLLGVDRRYVLKMLKEFPELDCALSAADGDSRRE